MPNLRRLGSEAEDRAADYLIQEGFTIVTRRYKTRHGELDLIALEGETLVFVEVKFRRAKGYLPEEAIGRAKLAAICSAAQDYLRDMEERRDYRFDVIAIDVSGLRHHRDILAN